VDFYSQLIGNGPLWEMLIAA